MKTHCIPLLSLALFFSSPLMAEKAPDKATEKIDYFLVRESDFIQCDVKRPDGPFAIIILEAGEKAFSHKAGDRFSLINDGTLVGAELIDPKLTEKCQNFEATMKYTPAFLKLDHPIKWNKYFSTPLLAFPEGKFRKDQVGKIVSVKPTSKNYPQETIAKRLPKKGDPEISVRKILFPGHPPLLTIVDFKYPTSKLDPKTGKRDFFYEMSFWTQDHGQWKEQVQLKESHIPAAFAIIYPGPDRFQVGVRINNTYTGSYDFIEYDRRDFKIKKRKILYSWGD